MVAVVKVVLHMTNCKGICDKKPKGECKTYFYILELIKALRNEAYELGYKFEIEKIDSAEPYSVPIKRTFQDKKKEIEETIKISVRDAIINRDKRTLDWEGGISRVDAYLRIHYDNNETRLIIINEIKMEN